MNAIFNLAQFVKKATCLRTITQYNSNNSLTPEFKWASFGKRNNLDEPKIHMIRTLFKANFLHSKSYSSSSVSVVRAIEQFYELNKAFHHKQRQFNCCFLWLLYFLSIISAFVTNIMYFIETLFWLRICLFRYVFCRLESSKHYILVRY